MNLLSKLEAWLPRVKHRPVPRQSAGCQLVGSCLPSPWVRLRIPYVNHSFFLVLHDARRRGWLPLGKGPGGSLHRTATRMHLKESGAVLLASLQPWERHYSPSPRGKSCGPHLRAGGHPSHRDRPVASDTSPHTAPSARALRHVTGDKYPTRRMSDSRQWGTPDLSPQRDLEKLSRSGMSAQEACKALKYRINDGSGSPVLV